MGVVMIVRGTHRSEHAHNESKWHLIANKYTEKVFLEYLKLDGYS